jgi:hypothetical protein
MPSRGRGYYYYQYDYYRQYYRRDDNLVTTKNGVNGNGDYSGQPEPVTPAKTGAQTQQSGGLRTLVKRNPRPKSGSNGPANGHGNGNPSQSKDANGGDGSAT